MSEIGQPEASHRSEYHTQYANRHPHSHRSSHRSARHSHSKLRHEDDNSPDMAPVSTVENEAPSRKTTDMWALVLLLAFLAGGVVVAVDSTARGSIPSLYRGVNYSGLVCGVDPPVLDMPFLYFPLDPTKSTHSLLLKDGRCVEACPSVDDVKAKRTIPVSRRDTQLDPKHGSAVVMEFRVQTPVYATRLVANSFCVPADAALARQLTPILASRSSQLSMALGGVASAWPVIVMFVGLGYALTVLMWVVMIRATAMLAVALSVAGAVVGCVMGGGYIVATGMFAVGGAEELRIVKSLYSMNYLWSIIVGVAVIGVGAAVGALAVASGRKLLTAAKTLEVTAVPLCDISSIFIPSAIATGVGVLFLSLWTFVLLKIAGRFGLAFEPVVMPLDRNGDFVAMPLHREMVFTGAGAVCLLYWLLLLFVAVEYVWAFLDFIVCYSSTVWYFSPPEGADERDVGWFPSLVAVKLGLLHHSGSFALGGVVMGATRPLRVAAQLVSASGARRILGDAFEERMGGVAALAKALSDQLSPTGFVEMSISSTPFWISMGAAAQRLLISAHPPTRLCGLTSFVTRSWLLFVAALTAACSCATLRSLTVFSSVGSPTFVSSPLLVAGLVGLFSAVLASHVTGVWAAAADAMLYCFLVESTGPTGQMDDNPMSKIHAPGQLKELIVDAIEEREEPRVGRYAVAAHNEALQEELGAGEEDVY
eukprot:Selendium_serpulae@DN6454_c2_g1_i1.p1